MSIGRVAKSALTQVDLTIPGTPVPRRQEQGRGNRRFLSKASQEYRERIQVSWMVEGRPYMGSVWLAMSARFYYERKKSHVRADGTLKDDAPAYPPAGDNTNLVKGLEDALNGLLYDDDKQIVMHTHIERLYADRGEEPRTELEVRVIG